MTPNIYAIYQEKRRLGMYVRMCNYEITSVLQKKITLKFEPIISNMKNICYLKVRTPRFHFIPTKKLFISI